MTYRADLYINRHRNYDVSVLGNERESVIRDILHYATIMMEKDVNKIRIELKEVKWTVEGMSITEKTKAVI